MRVGWGGAGIFARCMEQWGRIVWEKKGSEWLCQRRRRMKAQGSLSNIPSSMSVPKP
jgi:hypothetical protein